MFEKGCNFKENLRATGVARANGFAKVFDEGANMREGL
jgi:hypothetical protein